MINKVYISKNKIVSIILIIIITTISIPSIAYEDVSYTRLKETRDNIMTEKEVVVTKKNNSNELKKKQYYAEKKGLTIKEHPFVDAKTIDVIQHGTKVELLRRLPENWVKIKTKDYIGYALENELTENYTPVNIYGEETKANYIYMLGRGIPYKNTGKQYCQTQIDKYPNTAATYGGAPKFSGTDHHNTHFAAHNYGAFNGLWNMKKGDIIQVTDSDNNLFTYRVNGLKKVTYYGIGYADGVDYWNEITGYGNKERITLQTCIFGDDNGVWILDAYQE